MCDKYGTHMYLENNDMARGLFPEMKYKDLTICEKCAKREVGIKSWKMVKR